MNKKGICCLFVAFFCLGLLSPSTSSFDGFLPPHSTIDPIVPYRVTSPVITIRVTNATPVDNITLYYRYSENNYSDWCPGKDYVILTPGDHKTKTDDPNIDYPQRMWYDGENQLLYVVNYYQDNLQVWDVSDSDNIIKVRQLKNSYYLDYVHDVEVVNNWSYGGVDYGNVAFTVGHGSPMYFNSICANLSTTPAFLQNVELGRGELYTKLGYISVKKRGDCLYAAVSRLSGKLNIFNVTDPTNMVNMSYVRGTEEAAGHDSWWWVTWSPDSQYLYISGPGTNASTATYDVSNLFNPIIIGHQGNLNEWLCLPYYDRHDPNMVYAISRVGPGGDGNEYIKVFNASDPTSWDLLSSSGDTQNNGEWQTDFWTNDWAASRRYVSGGNQSGIVVWNIRNITDIYNAGTFARSAYTMHSHMQWLDYNNSRIFALALGLSGGNSIYVVKWQISLAQESSWYKYDIDTTAPWVWNFTFPKGLGFYEFCSIGRKTGEFPEAFPVSAEALCQYTDVTNDAPVFGAATPMNNSLDNPLSLVWHIPINDSEGDLFHWTIDCSNGQTSSGEWENNGIKTLELSGLTVDTEYTVWVNATDPTGSGLYTRAWYAFTTTHQQQNNPPMQPNKPDGETSGKLNTPYTYTTSTIDIDADQIYYLWDWGDGSQSSWLGPYNSGAIINTTHTWTVKSSSVKVKAKDTSGAESPWSDPLPISMTKDITFSFIPTYYSDSRADL